MSGTLPGLGRRFAPDDRDRTYPMRAHLPPPTALPSSRSWRIGPVLDQGATGTCVGHAWRDWLSAAPVMDNPTAGPSAFDIYDAAIKLDEWTDNDIDPQRQFGTSVRAAAKVIQTAGYLESYVWAASAEEARDFVLGKGPVVLGIDWPRAFFEPARDGTVRYRPDDAIAGGHAYLATGYSSKRGAFRCLNSWGMTYGDQGRFWLPGEALGALLARSGEACAGLEIRLERVMVG
jgi:hypothetical protein